MIFISEEKEICYCYRGILICCGISLCLTFPTCVCVLSAATMCVYVTVCGRVWLVTEFIYLILNQPSKSLIGPLLGNEGK